jgi:hypothetical protein
MKKIGKLQINNEKILSNDELKSLNGGWCGICEVFGVACGYFNGEACGDSQQDVQDKCDAMYNPYGCTCVCGWGS